MVAGVVAVVEAVRAVAGSVNGVARATARRDSADVRSRADMPCASC